MSEPKKKRYSISETVGDIVTRFCGPKSNSSRIARVQPSGQPNIARHPFQSPEFELQPLPPLRGPQISSSLSRPSRPSFPPWLINRMSRYLTADDFLALRMTSKTMEELAREPHRKAIYHTRRVFLNPRGIDHLFTIARKGHDVNYRVKNLVIVHNSPYRIGLRGYGKRGKNATLFREAAQVVKRTEGSLDGYDLQDLELSICNIRAVTGLFAQALTLLPKLETISFQRMPCVTLSREELNVFYPSSGMRPGTRIPKGLIESGALNCPPVNSLGNQLWRVTVDALIATINTRNPCRLRGIHDGSEYASYVGTSNDWFQAEGVRLGKHKKAFRHLRELSIRVDDFPWNSEAYIGAQILSLEKWLEAVGGKLELLSLTRSDSGWRDGSPTALPSLKGLSRLKRLRIGRFNFEVGEMQRLLKPCARLEFLSLDTVIMANDKDPKNHWLQFLKFLKRRCRRLRYIDLNLSTQRLPQAISIKRDYILPHHLRIGPGALASENPPCKVVFEGENNGRGACYTTRKMIAELLEKHHHADDFWNALTDGRWKRQFGQTPLRLYN
ncbi:hypothetical protein DRE_02968 [Drechslerella stenobrocha 248]|uniref:F-box domain-containing protein n=1 Tax=Drechslerella stenobrocha 248 TaxID=1043628 RepID=W7I6G0_9PEZI|nr:hypothetical protein DRE_02968 [Drechslerella stenobrocha 248]